MASRQYGPIDVLELPFSQLMKLVPSVGSIANGEVVKIECFDWTGGQIGNNDSADDVRDVDLTKIHYLSGPFHIETAEPGDILLVEIQDVQPFQDQPWGFTGVFGKNNGGGFLDDIYTEPYDFFFRVLQAISTDIRFAEQKLSGTLKASFAPRAISLTSAFLA